MNIDLRFLMSKKQLNRFKIISMVIEGNLKIVDAAKSLGFK